MFRLEFQLQSDWRKLIKGDTYFLRCRICHMFPTIEKVANDPRYIKHYSPDDFMKVQVKRSKENNFLFREESSMVYVQSGVKPNFQFGFEKVLELQNSLFEPRITEITTLYEKDQILFFNVKVNVIKRIGLEQKKEICITSPKEQEDYFQKFSSQNGFEIQKLKIDYKGSHFQEDNKKGRITNPVVYSGALKVTNSQLFEDILVQGIGRSKCYGYGLMLVRLP